jgi:hypothetical protein
MPVFLVSYGKENNCSSGIAMFITRRHSTAASCKFPENGTIKVFGFIYLGISQHFGVVATVVQNSIGNMRVRM